MCSRFVELVALGSELRNLAERRGEGVNEAFFLVHQVLQEAFLDMDRLPSQGLREHLSAQLERRLDARAAQAPEPAMTPVLWTFAARRCAPPDCMASPAE
jgi:hypothetical protein